ncbi:MAG: histidine kinase N-terminal 7TM domain-containing protein [Minisyncoccia bacterium]
MPIEVTLLFITAVVNSILSLFVMFGKRDRTNFVYSMFVLFAAFWALGLALFILENDLDRALIIANTYYIAAAGIPTFFLYFTLVFPNQNKSLSRYVPFLFVPIFLLSLGLAFDKNYLIKEIFITGDSKDVDLNYGSYFVYSLFFVILVVIAYINLFKSYINAKNSDKINQLKFILIGTAVGFIFGMIFNLILPAIGDYSQIWLGPLFSFIMVTSIGYSISRFHLFNMKVVATEISTFVLWIVILVRTLVSQTLTDQITNGIILLATVIIGIFIIRSVIKEVKQREQIEKLAGDLKRANEGQVSLMHFMNHQVKGRFGNAKNIFAELMTEDYGVMPREALPLLEKGLEETNMGIDYVQNILKGTSAESGSLLYDMKLFDYRKVLEEEFERERGKAEQKSLKFELKVDEGDYNLNGDHRQLSEATRNLIDNSITYTLSGSIVVNLSFDKYAIKLTITDTGVGLTTSDKNSLFKSGGRGSESLKFNVNSTGYGLAFVKGVVDAHKGRVWAESGGRGKGSVFYMELPKT